MPFQSNDEIRFQCRHILTDGRRCKNPTLRSPRTEENPQGHENFCYFHHTTRGAASMTRNMTHKTRVPHSCAVSSRMSGGQSTFTLPLLEDRSSIQFAISQVLQQIASNEIDPRRAGLLLYGLQVASLNLKKGNYPLNSSTWYYGPVSFQSEWDTATLVQNCVSNCTKSERR